MPATIAPEERNSSLTMKPFVKSSYSIDTEPLNALDRCDRCGAAAYVRAVKDSSQLLFCGNHGRSVYETLAGQDWKIDDQTHRAFDRPSAPQTDD
jgi:hypothetical protein